MFHVKHPEISRANLGIRFGVSEWTIGEILKGTRICDKGGRNG